MKTTTNALRLLSTLAGIVLLSVPLAVGAEPQSPVEPVPDRDVYHPGTEALGKNEMRVTACGTGMPNARPAQAADAGAVLRYSAERFLRGAGPHLDALELALTLDALALFLLAAARRRDGERRAASAARELVDELLLTAAARLVEDVPMAKHVP